DEALDEYAPAEPVERGAIDEIKTDRVVEAPGRVPLANEVALLGTCDDSTARPSREQGGQAHPRRGCTPREGGTQARRAKPVPLRPVVLQTRQRQEEQQ